jgi:hypothetical protein
MRDYGKVSPKFWTGDTGKAIKKKGADAVIVAVYLMTSPHSNMLGLFYQPVLYMAHETGLGIEGASKGLAECIEAGFCAYDEASEMVWVFEMATYQIAAALKPDDKRCKGVQKDYDALPRNPYLGEFFDRYCEAFHLQERRSCEAPSMPHASQEQEQEQEQDQEQKQETPPRKRVATPPIARPEDVCESVWRDWTALRAKKRTTVSETAIEGARAEAAKAGLSLEAFLRIWVTRGSQGMEAAWIKPEERRAAASFAERDREEGMRRWEEMTGRVHPDRQPRPAGVVIDMPATPQLAIGGRQ